MNRAVPDEADVPPSQSQASQQARVPREDEDSGRSGHPFASPEEGPRPSRGDGGQQVGAQGSRAGEGLSRPVRIRHTDEIRALLERGKRKRTKHVDVFLAPSPVPFSRLGVIVPKHGRTIVERNELKRRIREIGRRTVLPEAARRGLVVDVLVRARGEAYAAGFGDLEGGIREAVEALWSDAR
jgi:ribonuclease P protein component